MKVVFPVPGNKSKNISNVLVLQKATPGNVMEVNLTTKRKINVMTRI